MSLLNSLKSTAHPVKYPPLSLEKLRKRIQNGRQVTSCDCSHCSRTNPLIKWHAIWATITERESSIRQPRSDYSLPKFSIGTSPTGGYACRTEFYFKSNG